MSNLDIIPFDQDRYDICCSNKTVSDFCDGYEYPYKQAIDMYHNYKEDIRLFAEMGFKVYRLSI